MPPETIVGVKFRKWFLGRGGRAGGYYWHHGGGDDDIVEYCIVTEQADLDAAERLLLATGYVITPPTRPITFEDVEPMTAAPPDGTEYWAVSPGQKEGVYCNTFYNDEYDSLYIKRRVAYLDKEDALIAARHIFGLKGGEL